jgi:hypothetical protein
MLPTEIVRGFPMHGGFGGGGGGGMGHSGGGGGHHSGGGHHGGELNPTAIASHGLGGPSQSIFGHIAALGQNPQGIIGHIASFLTGQHQATHHAGGASSQANQHIGDQSWTSSGLQVEQGALWRKRIAKMPAFQIMAVFLVIVGWLFFLGMVRHGDAEHAARTPTTQNEWRQQLTGNGQAQNGEAATEATAEAPAQGGFGQAAPNASAFGMPRDVEGAVAPNLSNYVPQAYVMTSAPTAYGQSAYGSQSAGSMGNPMMASSMAAPAASQYAAPVASSAPAAQLGRRSFSARAALSSPQEGQQAGPSYAAGDPYAPLESRRGFHHRVVAER